jgi:hypothetical protein
MRKTPNSFLRLYVISIWQSNRGRGLCICLFCCFEVVLQNPCTNLCIPFFTQHYFAMVCLNTSSTHGDNLAKQIYLPCLMLCADLSSTDATSACYYIHIP